jgi:hypothetical protein
VHISKLHTWLVAIATAIILLNISILLLPTNTTTNASTIEATGIKVYWNSACTQPVTSITWGKLYPGSVKKQTVYIRNENTVPVRFVFVKTQNWNPQTASLAYSGQQLNPNQVAQTTLTLTVLLTIHDVESFQFTMVIYASEFKGGDVDHDNDIDLNDLTLFAHAYGSKTGTTNWNPNADFDVSGSVSLIDLIMLATHYGD